MITRRQQQSAIQRRAPQPNRDLASWMQPRAVVQRYAPAAFQGGTASTLGPRAAVNADPLTANQRFLSGQGGLGSSWGIPQGWMPDKSPAPVQTPAPAPMPTPVPAPVPQPQGSPAVGQQRVNPIEMNPQYQAGIAQLDDEMRRALANYDIAGEEAEALMRLAKERMGIQHQESLRRVDESANERGIYNSGIRMRDRGYTDLDFGQQYQDLELDRARRLREIAEGKAGAVEGRRRGQNDLAMRIAEYLAQTLPDDVVGSAPTDSLTRVDPPRAPQAPTGGGGGGSVVRRRRNSNWGGRR